MSLNRPPAVTHTDHSGAITTAAVAQPLMPSNPMRIGMKLQNISAYTIWVMTDDESADTNGAEASMPGNWMVAAGTIFEFPEYAPLGPMSIYCATAGAQFTCKEWGV